MNKINKINKQKPFAVAGTIIASIFILALLPVFIKSSLIRLIAYSFVGVTLVSILNIKKAAKFKNVNYAVFYYTTLFLLGGAAIYIALFTSFVNRFSISMLLVVLLFIFLVISYGFVDDEDSYKEPT